MKALRYIAIGVAALVGFAVVAAGIVSLAFDANRYKPDLIRSVQERTGRKLAIDGNIALRFVPHLGIAVDRLALSGPGGEGSFASVGEARLAVALMPLLSGRLVVDQVDLSGVEVGLLRRKDGTTNFDDLGAVDARPTPATLPPPPADAPPSLALEISGVRLRQANIAWQDEADGRSVRLAGLDATIDRIAEGARGRIQIATGVEGSKPNLRVEVKGSAGYRLDFAKGAFALEGIELRVEGDAPGAPGLVATMKGDIEFDAARELVDIAKLTVVLATRDGLDLKANVPKLRLAPAGTAGEAASAEVTLVRPQGTLRAKLELSSLVAKETQVQFERLGLDAEVRHGETNFVVRLASPLAVDFAARRVELSSLSGELAASGAQIPKQSAKGSVSGTATVAWGQPSGARADLSGRIDDSNLKLKIVLADFDKPSFEFDVTADRLDLDHYFPAVSGKGAQVPAGGSGGAAPEQAIELSGIGKLNARGSLRIGALVARHLKVENLHVGLRAAGGTIDLAPLNAKLYQGTLAGSAQLNARTNHFSIRQQLTGVAVGPLLRDLAGFDRLEGRGNLALDVTASGTTVGALKRNLDGSVRIDMRDGAVKGVNLGEIVEAAGTQLGTVSSVEGRARATDQTEFSELAGSFVIRSGVARTDDLAGRSPLLKMTGSGSVDLQQERIDALVKVTPVGTLPIGGRRPLTVLQGVTVPVRIAGSLAAPEYSVDLARLAVESAKTGVRLSIGAAAAVPGVAVPLVEGLLQGMRRKK